MAKLVSKKTTTTVTEEVEIIPATPGTEQGHRYLKVCGYGMFFATPFRYFNYATNRYGTYRDTDGDEVVKPQINLNAKWLAEAGFNVGDQIDVEVTENKLVIRKLCIGI